MPVPFVIATRNDRWCSSAEKVDLRAEGAAAAADLWAVEELSHPRGLLLQRGLPELFSIENAANR
jgi:hypothetical protein